MRSTRLAANTGRKRSHLGTIAQLCRAISSQLRHVSTIGKNLLSSSASSTCPDNMVNFGPLAVEIGSGVWGAPTNFNGFCVLAALLHRTLVVGVSQTLRRNVVSASFIIFWLRWRHKSRDLKTCRWSSSTMTSRPTLLPFPLYTARLWVNVTFDLMRPHNCTASLGYRWTKRELNVSLCSKVSDSQSDRQTDR